MKSTIIKIGNSHGLRIPKPILEQCGLQGEVELKVQNHQLIITSIKKPRDTWEKAFKAMAENKDDVLLDSDVPSATQWDEEEWEWK